VGHGRDGGASERNPRVGLCSPRFSFDAEQTLGFRRLAKSGWVANVKNEALGRAVCSCWTKLEPQIGQEVHGLCLGWAHILSRQAEFAIQILTNYASLSVNRYCQVSPR